MRAEKLVLWSAYILQLGVQLVDDLSDLPGIWYICQLVFDYGITSIKCVARRTRRNKTEIKQTCRRSAVSFQPTVDSFVSFQFHHVRTLKLFHVVSVFYFRDVRTPEIKQKIFSSQPITGSIV